MFSSQRNGVNHTNPYFRSRSTILYASTLYPSRGQRESQIHFYFGPSLALFFFVFLVFWDIENNVLKYISIFDNMRFNAIFKVL